MPNLSIPYTFNPSTLIQSNQVNVNFATIQAHLSPTQTAYLTDVQTFTNKTIGDALTLTGQASTPTTPSAGFGKFYQKTDGKFYTLNDAGVEVALGTGSGGINYITNSDAEGGTTGWATYVNTAGTAPVNGAGGTANVTWTQTATTPLRGLKSFLFTKDAANRQGQGVSTDFTIDRADQGKVLNISFNYEIASGTYASSDLSVWIYDKTNATILQPQPSSLDLITATGGQQYSGTFQAAGNSNSYRLIIHCGSTSTSAFTVEFDTVVVGPQLITQGTPVTDWVSYTPTFTGFGTVSSVEFESRRVGGSLEIKGKFTSGTSTATEARVTLGFNGGNANVSAASFSSIKVCGLSARSGSGTDQVYVLTEPNVNYVTFGIQGSAAGLTKANGNGFVAAGTVFAFVATVPIAGWSSQVQMSSESATRIITARAGRSTTQSIANATTTTVVFDSLTNGGDRTSSLNTSTGVYTVAVPGDYFVGSMIEFAGSATGTRTVTIKSVRGGSTVNTTIGVQAGAAGGNFVSGGDMLLGLRAGDTIEIQVLQSSGGALNIASSGIGATYVTIERISGPVQLARSEEATATAVQTTGQSITNGSTVTVTYSSKIWDNLNALNASTGEYTVQVPGRYLVSCSFTMGANTFTNGNKVTAYVFKNGSLFCVLGRLYFNATASQEANVSGSMVVPCIAGDILTVRIDHGEATARSLLASSGFNTVSFSKQS